MKTTWDGEVCDDCIIAIAYDDYTGMDDEREAAVRAGLGRINSKYGYLVAGDKTAEFTGRSCECCGAGGGRRHRAAAIAAESMTTRVWMRAKSGVARRRLKARGLSKALAETADRLPKRHARLKALEV